MCLESPATAVNGLCRDMSIRDHGTVSTHSVPNVSSIGIDKLRQLARPTSP